MSCRVTGRRWVAVVTWRMVAGAPGRPCPVQIAAGYDDRVAAAVAGLPGRRPRPPTRSPEGRRSPTGTAGDALRATAYGAFTTDILVLLAPAGVAGGGCADRAQPPRRAPGATAEHRRDLRGRRRSAPLARPD